MPDSFKKSVKISLMNPCSLTSKSVNIPEDNRKQF